MALFSFVDGLRRPAVAAAGSGLDLDKSQYPLADGDYIDFAVGGRYSFW